MSRPAPAPRLHLTLLPEAFAVCRLDPDAAAPGGLASAAFLSITRTPDELSVVCAEEHAPEGARCEKGWRCLRVRGPIPFAVTGVLAALAAPLADAGIPIFAVSTFDTDYLLVKDAQLAASIAALEAAGHEVARALAFRTPRAPG
jgi:uncharacterized protein